MKEENSLTLQSIVSRNPEIIHSAMDDEVVMMSVDQGLFFGLDKIGAHIWELLETPKTGEEVITLLLSQYDVTRDQCENDTLRFLSNMLDKKVISIHTNQPG